MKPLAQYAGRLAAIVPIAVCAIAADSPSLDRAALDDISARFSFKASLLPTAGNGQNRDTRTVHPALDRISGWISSVGASIAFADLDTDGLANDFCLVDPRSDTVTVAPVPVAAVPRYRLFNLATPAGQFEADTIAPMGCMPADVNGDGMMDLVVYYWGRSPVIFEALSTSPSPDSYRIRAITNERDTWFTNAATFADIDGDGHGDLLFGNYFADGSGILDASGRMPAEMQHSMSRAFNGGTNRLFLNTGSASGEVRFEDHSDALTSQMANGWTLALGAADLNGDLLPEIYVANDFGPDRMLLNGSRPGQPVFTLVEGRRGLADIRSAALGRDSFKGMGVDFADVDGDGRLDIYVSNIAEEYALMENHFLFLHTGDEDDWDRGNAPYRNASGPLGLARSAWSWDVKLADFDSDGRVEAVQTTGFLKGSRDRWPELHELAMANDELLRHAGIWPFFRNQDDLSGDHHDRFHVADDDGVFHDIAPLIGLGGASVSRAIATADVDGDGDLDLAIARQWEPSWFYENTGAENGRSLILDLQLKSPDGRLRPAIGASARVGMPDGSSLVSFADGGNGHGGRRSHHVHFGLGQASDNDRFDVALSWRMDGQLHRRDLFLAPGTHRIVLNEARLAADTSQPQEPSLITVLTEKTQ